MSGLSSEFVSAIAGAVVGGLIAFGIQMIALRAAVKARKDEAAEKKKALAHSLMFKMLQIHAHLLHFSQHLEEAFAQGAADNIPEPWAFVQAMANHPDKVNFASDEMAMLLSLGDETLFSDVLSFDEAHNTTIATFDTYRERRVLFTDRLSAIIADHVSIKGATDLSEDEMLFFRPKMNELNNLATVMRQMTAGYAKDAGDVSKRLALVLHERAGLVRKLEVAPKPAPT